jgi:hypothetical protein
MTVQDLFFTLLFSLDYYHLKTAFMVAVGREVKSRERGVKNKYNIVRKNLKLKGLFFLCFYIRVLWLLI